MITITGDSLTDINMTLSDAVFTPDEGFNGDATITVTQKTLKEGQTLKL